MQSTLSTVLERQASAVVGREHERARLLDGAAAVTWMHGIAGSGKTALLRAFAAEAHATVVTIDCRTVEPTEAGFLAALSRAAGVPADTVAAGAEALDRKVLVLDGFHGLPLLDMWLRMTFLPRLPASARAVIASREPPMAAWSADFGQLLRTLALGPLPPAAAEALLRRTGVPAAQARAVNRFAHGHPLSLVLAAAALEERPGRELEQTALPAVADTLARLYLEGLDADTRRALDAASVTRRITLSLLGALLPGEPPHEAFERLRALPFTELGADGLVVQDTVRESVAAVLRAGDPAAHRRLRVAAWHHLRAEMRDAAPHDLWRYTADMLYLIETPAVRDIYFPTTAPQHAHEPAQPDDWAGIEAIARAQQPEEAIAILRRWWEHAPETFVVARDATGAVSGFYYLFVPRDVSPRVIDADPVASAWRDHLRRNPLPHGQIALFIRGWGQRTDQSPAAGQPSICLDIKRTYLALRPALTRVYLGVEDLAAGAEAFGALGFTHAPGHEARLGGEPMHTMASDFGPGSVDGWLADLGARELNLDVRSPLDDLDLTRLEQGVLGHLLRNEGRVVSRAELFREVWDTDHQGDGNALEAVVSTLRRKLGPRAKALQTVRGAGYRLTGLS